MGSSALLLLKLALLAAYYTTAAVPTPARPAHCIKKCGNVDISYPFGTKEDGCFKDPDFQINCTRNSSNGHRIPYLARETYEEHDIEVLKISEDTSEIYVSMPVSYACYDPKHSSDYHQKVRYQMPSKFGISNEKNKFFVRGCATYALLFDRRGKRLNGCETICSKEESSLVTSNNGTCQTDFELAVANYTINIFFYDESYSSVTWCSYAFVALIGSFNYYDDNDLKKIRETKRSTVVLDWAVDNTNSCGGACKGNNTECVESESVSGHYFCRCKPGFLGNPYRDDGCKGDYITILPFCNPR